jgi:hypothetical protein
MSEKPKKPTSYYHMSVCRHTESGWQVRKHGLFHGEAGTFLSKDTQIVFVGWSGSVVILES